MPAKYAHAIHFPLASIYKHRLNAEGKDLFDDSLLRADNGAIFELVSSKIDMWDLGGVCA
jgi:hypothetical protein